MNPLRDASIPIIRLEVEAMKHTIRMAMSEHVAKMDADIQAAVERACTPENVAAVVQKTAYEEIERAIKESVQDFFRYGDGRAAVKAEVLRKLEKQP